MKYFLLFALIFFFYNTQSTDAGNPFGKPSGSHESQTSSPKPPYPLYLKIAAIQHKLNARLTSLVNEYRETKSLNPIIPLIAVAFLYGIVHAAGPGHGKAVAVSYLVSRGRRVYDGFFIGSSIAILHGISGISLVLILKCFLGTGVMGQLGDITRVTKLVSYSSILTVGILLTGKNLYTWYRNTGTRRDGYSGICDSKPAGSLTMAVVIGMVPCPGAVIIMLFALSINMTGLGIVLASAQTLGMAATISLIGTLFVAGKLKSFNMLDYQRRSIADTIEHLVETSASVAVVGLGILLLMTVC